MFNETRMPLGLILATAFGTPVLAQVPPATADAMAEGSGGGIGEIIVTAQRREQALQKVPVAVSTVNAAQIAARRLNNIDQITGIAPNLVITTGNGSSSSTQIAVRGSVTTNNTINYDPAVGLYLDGVYVGKAAGSVFDIGDLERVEVLRGPQGTLFGRNTLAGAISFVTRKPEDKLRIEGELTYGNYNAMAGRGVLNLPLADTLFIKVSGQFQKRDGFTKLVPDPFGLPAALAHSATGRLDDRDRYSVMGQVRWQPTDALTLDYSYDLSHTNEHPFTGLFGIGSGNIFDPNSPIYSGLPLYLYVIPGDNRPKTTSSDIRTRDRSRVYGHSLTASYDLGFATAKSITAYRTVTTHPGPLGQDLDGSPMAIATGGYVNHYSQFSQELQLTGAVWDDRISYVNYGLLLYQNGDQRGAMPWLEKAAELGDPRAQYVVGTALFNGDPLPRDWVRAYALMSRAAGSGLPTAVTSLAEMDRYIPASQRQQARARPSTEKAQLASLPARSESRPARTPARTRAAAVAPAPSADGRWRIQLGAFADGTRADGLWRSIQASQPTLATAQSYLVKAGAVTRLQAGPFASRADADQACAAIRAGGHACFSATTP